MANDKPIHNVKIGSIRAAVWANEGKKGVWYNVTVTRSYHDGEAMQDTTSFGTGDLLAVSKAADLAHTWCLENRPTN